MLTPNSITIFLDSKKISRLYFQKGKHCGRAYVKEIKVKPHLKHIEICFDGNSEYYDGYDYTIGIDTTGLPDNKETTC